MANKPPHKNSTEEEAHRILKRVESESEVLGQSSMVKTAEKMTDHFSAKDADEKDAAEVWGTRIGRILSLAGVIYLSYYLIKTYVING